MRLRIIGSSILVSVLILVSGCAKRVPISYDQAQPNAVVQITTSSGRVCQGQIDKISPTHLVLRPNKYSNSHITLNRNEISSISGRDFVYDGRGEIISEWEIQSKKKNRNVYFYTLGGAGLSFGASFFIGSMMHRGMDDSDTGQTVQWSTTGAGTVLGTLLFARAGARRDRFAAIEEIRDERYNLALEKMNAEKEKRQKVQQELSKLKADRDKKNDEIQQLQEQVKKQEKK
ncbi:MAG: hypothetical protein ACOY90_09680 [Candidatus Zhuqueibacterota bacterium]